MTIFLADTSVWFASCCCEGKPTKSQVGKRVCFSFSLQFFMEGSQGRTSGPDPEAGTAAETMEEGSLLAHSSASHSSGFLITPRGGTTHSGLGPPTNPTSVINQENAPQTQLQASLMVEFVSGEGPSSQVTLACVELTKN